MKYWTISIVAFFLLINIRPIRADVVNGSFESEDLTGWELVQGSIEVLQASNFSPGIPVPDGDHYVLISNINTDGSALDNDPYSDADGNGSSDNEQTILRQAFTSVSGEVLSFQWSWLTSEEDEGYIFDDIFYVRLDGSIILSGSVYKPLEIPFSPFLTF